MSIQGEEDYTLVQDNRIEVNFYCLPCCVENRADEILCLLDVLFSNLPLYLPSQRIYCTRTGKGYSLRLRLQSSCSLDDDMIDDLDYLYQKACKGNPRLKGSYVYSLKTPCQFP
ncbi:hypothetical protein BQ9231_00518 [Cedratvirus lausannensis]|uniref:Uncharacterized protein n=1 Tax=Cedratvirus lausannensis TaxID=2023205 RepID=A0A285PXP7_9VIRU|nr:hypothetical protein BQ9231_00518 [Cedratvirus lausannensis]